MAILNNQSFMGMRNYSMPPALSGYDLTPAQRHARDTEPVLSVGYNKNGDLVPVNHSSMTGVPDDILRFLRRTDNTDYTGGFRHEAIADLPTHGETLDNRYSSILMNQDHARSAMGDAVEYKGLDLSDSKSHSDGGILTKLLSGLSRDAITFAKDVKQHGISVTYNGNEIFATDGKNTVPVTEETAAAINDANNDVSGPAVSPNGEQHPDTAAYYPEMPVKPAALTEDTKVGPNTSKGVLSSNNGTAASNGNVARRMTGGYTGNARGSALPNMQIGLGERLMRMGMAGLSKGGQGSLAQLGAMYGASADVNQANRQASMDTFKIEEERRQAHANRVAALAASKNKGAGGGGGDEVNAVRGAMSKLQTALNMFEADTDSSISGFNWQAIGSRLFGRAFGNEDEAKRLFLNELRLDSIMQRVQETKGAISNAEMQLFASQAPTMNSNDIVWTSWIKRQLQMQQIILNRVQAGQRIDPNAPITETMPNLNTGGGGSTGSGADFAGADKLVGI